MRTTRAGWIIPRSAMLVLLGAACLVGAACGADSSSNQPVYNTGGSPNADASADGDASVTDGPKPDTKPDVINDTTPEGGGCVPKTCAQLTAECGSVPDGCGGKVDCGTCKTGQLCGGGGANKCGTNACVPKTCAQVGASCGFASDGCATAIDCGGCTPPAQCGGTGKLNECGCQPKSCAQLGVTCGTVPDGCGAVKDCGSCPSGQTCGGGGPNLCGTGACTAKTCSQLGASCGPISDGCSKAIDCGTCKAPDSCGGAGKDNQCGCTSKTCSQLSATCGQVNNGCTTVDCGTCGTGETCEGGGVKNQCGCKCDLPHATTTCAGGKCSLAACTAGWGDCDSDATNGCEVDLNTTLTSCGTCGTGCSFANATAQCAAGKCVLASCDANYADCNKDPADGCEANLQSDPNNCLTCGTVCTAPSGTPECKLGVCGVSNCNPGAGDCDGNQANGCETNTTNSQQHCGACNNPCDLQNATSVCSASKCSIQVCTAGFGNCDANESNGCETNVDISTLHCGNCTTTCATPNNATASCTAGTCGFNCNGGWSDCDSSSANGCEINTDSDATHCGTCTTVCTAAHATSNCVSGQCGIASCAGGYANCDNNIANGCEVNTMSDTGHCGNCSTNCAVPNAQVACSTGVCLLQTCNSGFANCDNQYANGCEINIGNDPQHCGSCTKVCNSNNGTATCNTGVCGINCNAGFANCDGNTNNGCEVNTNTSLSNCGGCGQVCSNNNGTPSCASGTCQIACNPGFADCDGNPANGCEIDITSDVTHCGACPNVCNSINGTPSCSGGTCSLTCNSGWGNCDGQLNNGCEINLNGDITHCGNCATACSSVNGTPSCNNGNCAIACNTFFGNCDGLVTNGCEVNLNSDINHCGSCPTVCNSTNGTATCTGGTCGINCTAPFQNCDGLLNNGCESNSQADAAHCGNCSTNCNSPAQANVSSANCSGAACHVATCNAGFYDKDGTFNNGCECTVDTMPDTCAGATSTTTVAVDATTYLPSSSGNYSITPTGDEDWFRVTFTTIASTAFNPRIQLIDNSGTGLLRMAVYGTACGGAGIACSVAETGTTTKGITDWQFNWQAACADLNPVCDPTPATGSFITIPTTVLVRVYTTAGSTNCLNYRLILSN
ncbi:MAG: hypothetical protein HY898_17360 [Deltaproteobacteria bacterium]|nr:hypothetical protein [Deltaproteobacteria bacterium]